MSIYQISKILNRRGKRIDLPQPLSSAEFGWAIDSQELFIGNGSVAEGAPGIGNTKILTEHDDLLQLMSQYQYKVNEYYIQTGTSPNTPVKRSLQDRLDDFVSNYAFDIQADETDQSAKLQNAINTLFANPVSKTDPASRVVLNFLPGEYCINKPVYIPSYTNILGAGIDKTIFKFSDTGMFIFVSDEFNYDILSELYLTDREYFNENTQPKFCFISDFTVSINTLPLNPAIILNCTRNSIFNNIKLRNRYVDKSIPSGIGMFMYANSIYSNFTQNIFNNISFDQFRYGIYSYSKIYTNTFNDLEFTNCYNGIQIGQPTAEVDVDFVIHSSNDFSNVDTSSSYNNTIENNTFKNIYYEGINLITGSNNVITQCAFENVGNSDGTIAGIPTYHHIYLGRDGNYCNDNTFDRDDFINMSSTMKYVYPIGGKYYYENDNSKSLAISAIGTNKEDIFRLPINDNSNIEVSYILKDSTGTRKGTFFITTGGSLQFSDDFTHTSTDIGNIVFDATISLDTCILVSVQNVANYTDMSFTFSILN